MTTAFSSILPHSSCASRVPKISVPCRVNLIYPTFQAPIHATVKVVFSQCSDFEVICSLSTWTRISNTIFQVCAPGAREDLHTRSHRIPHSTCFELSYVYQEKVKYTSKKLL